MSSKVLYHGTDHIIEEPRFHDPRSNPHNDYGYGFYCTLNLDMAKEWANIALEHGIVNKYSFDERGLRILNLTDKNQYNVLNWLSTLVHNRRFNEGFKELHQREIAYLEDTYQRLQIEDVDVIVGYRADDAYFRFPLIFLDNRLTYEKLEEIYLNGNLGAQYVIVSERAFKRLRFVKAIKAEPIYHQRYQARKDTANRFYTALELEQRYAEGTRILEMIKHHD